MARLTNEYIRRAFLEQFAAMGADRRAGTIEALTVIHETQVAREQAPLGEGVSFESKGAGRLFFENGIAVAPAAPA